MTKIRKGIYLEEERIKMIEKKAKEMGLTFNGMINVALNEFLKQETVVDMMNVYKQMQEDAKGVKRSG